MNWIFFACFKFKVPSTSSLEKEKNIDTEEDCHQLAHDPLALDDRNSRYKKYTIYPFLTYRFVWTLQNFTLSISFSNLFSDECFIKPCSSKATSVIRLACQKSPKPSTSSLPTAVNVSSTSQTKGESIRPNNRQSVKKLVLKLKKPFVPVIEEEANLHPPGECKTCPPHYTVIYLENFT